MKFDSFYKNQPVINTAVILAGGPSLRTQDISILFNSKEAPFQIITINDSWRLVPGRKRKNVIHWFTDYNWFSMQQARNPYSVDMDLCFHDSIYRRKWFTIEHAYFDDHPQIITVPCTGQMGLELKEIGIRHGSNGGYAAINLAVMFGAKKIILLGYDMKVDPNTQRTHWHNDNPITANAFDSVIRDSFLPMFPLMLDDLKEAGVEVINATPCSALKVFPQKSLEYALEDISEKQVQVKEITQLQLWPQTQL